MDDDVAAILHDILDRVGTDDFETSHSSMESSRASPECLLRDARLHVGPAIETHYHITGLPWTFSIESISDVVLDVFEWLVSQVEHNESLSLVPTRVVSAAQISSTPSLIQAGSMELEAHRADRGIAELTQRNLPASRLTELARTLTDSQSSAGLSEPVEELMEISNILNNMLEIVEEEQAAASRSREHETNNQATEAWMQELEQACFAAPQRNDIPTISFRNTWKDITRVPTDPASRLPRMEFMGVTVERPLCEPSLGDNTSIEFNPDDHKVEILSIAPQKLQLVASVMSYIDEPVSQNSKCDTRSDPDPASSGHVETLQRARIRHECVHQYLESSSPTFSMSSPRSIPVLLRKNGWSRTEARLHETPSKPNIFDSNCEKETVADKVPMATTAALHTVESLPRPITSEDPAPIKVLKRPFKKHVLSVSSRYPSQSCPKPGDSPGPDERMKSFDCSGKSKVKYRQPFKGLAISPGARLEDMTIPEAMLFGKEVLDDTQSIQDRRSSTSENVHSLDSRRPRPPYSASTRLVESAEKHDSLLADDSFSSTHDQEQDFNDADESSPLPKRVKRSFAKPPLTLSTHTYPKTDPINLQLLSEEVCELSYPKSMSTGSSRARASFRPPGHSTKMLMDSPETSTIRIDSEASSISGNRGWETAAGRVLDIPHDASLAAEWTVVAQKCTNVAVEQVQSLDSRHSGVAQATSGEASSHALRALRERHISLQKTLLDLREEVKSIESALTIESRDEDARLLELMAKWKDVAQQACEEVFLTVSAKIEQAGGFQVWSKTQRFQQWNDYSQAESSQVQQQDEYELTAEEKVAMGVEADCFTMEMMLVQLGIPMELIDYDADLCRWR